MNTLCKIRDISRSIADFEVRFEKKYKLCFNEGMLLCTLSDVEQLSSGEIAEQLGLTTSNTSKVIKSAEGKGLIRRALGSIDKRQMYFSLTDEGRAQLAAIDCESIGMPDFLKTLL